MSTKKRTDGHFKLESEEEEKLEEGEIDAVEVEENHDNESFKTSARFEKK